MKALKVFFLNLIILMSVLSCSNDNSVVITEQSLEYFEELNVSYGTNSDQKFDIYLPANRTLNTKVVILVHGGGWSAGDKNDMNGFVDLIFQNFENLAVVNINYRLADDNNPPYPMQTNDITSIINHLKENKNNYVIGDEFGFIGTSAGAHLAMLWSYALDANSNINMVCSIVGPTNFTDPAYLNNANTNLQELIDLYGINATTEFLEEISPYHKVTDSSPPTILFNGGQDPLVPTTQGTDMRDKLLELGVIHEFTLYENEGHGWTGINALDTWVKLMTFINTYL